MEQNMPIRNIYFAIIVLSVFITSCSLDKEEQIPSYVYIPSVSLQTTAGQGAATEKITEVWVYANDLLLGAYNLPATVPVLESGDTKIEIFAGIKDNGIITTPELYPMFETIIQTVNLVAAEIDTIVPVFSYKSNVKFAFVESFESNQIFNFEVDGNLGTALSSTSEEAKSGSRSGKINLTQTNNFIRVANEIRLDELPTNGSAVYLEFDYKNDIQFSIGLIGYDPNVNDVSQLILTLREKEDWNKVYINLTTELQLSQLPTYRVLIDAMLEEDAGATGNIYLDNIKLVYL